MNRPYIICHMMTSLDGRIDCAMTEQLPGVQEYDTTFASFDAPTCVNGRVTAELEMALPGKFSCQESKPLQKEAFHKVLSADGYEVVVDTYGSLLWQNQKGQHRPILVLTSEKVNQEYLSYLEERNISWIACGKDHVDLSRACEILIDNFGIKRMALVGGGHINAGFLKSGLIDEISILIGAGIDGRSGMGVVFDGLEMDRPVTPLRLEQVRAFESGAVWIRYKVKQNS